MTRAMMAMGLGVMMGLGAMMGLSGCGECVDCLPLPPALSSATLPSATVTTERPGALWWLPPGDDTTLRIEGREPIPLDVVVTTSTRRALRIPDLPGGTAGRVGDVDVFVSVSAVPLPTTTPSWVVRAEPLRGCLSSCRTELEPPRPTTVEIPGIAVEVDEADVRLLAIDLWTGVEAAPEEDARFGDTVPLDWGFDDPDTGELRRGGRLHLPVDAGAWTLRLRRLSDGAVSSLVTVTAE